MKKIIFLLLLLIPFSVNALTCNQDELLTSKKNASTVNTNLVMGKVYRPFTDPDTSEVSMREVKVFNYQVTNLTDDIYVMLYKDSELLFDSRINTYDNHEYELVISDFKELSTLSLDIYANTDTCVDTFIRNIKNDLPIYNKLYNSSACIGIESFYLCQEFVYTNYNLVDGYIDLMDRYRSEAIEEEKKADKDISWLDKINNFVKDNQLYFYMIIAFLGGFIIICFIRRYKRMKKHFGKVKKSGKKKKNLVKLKK